MINFFKKVLKKFDQVLVNNLEIKYDNQSFEEPQILIGCVTEKEETNIFDDKGKQIFTITYDGIDTVSTSAENCLRSKYGFWFTPIKHIRSNSVYFICCSHYPYSTMGSMISFYSPMVYIYLLHILKFPKTNFIPQEWAIFVKQSYFFYKFTYKLQTMNFAHFRQDGFHGLDFETVKNHYDMYYENYYFLNVNELYKIFKSKLPMEIVQIIWDMSRREDLTRIYPLLLDSHLYNFLQMNYH